MYGRQITVRDDKSDYAVYHPPGITSIPFRGIPPDGYVCVSIDPAIAAFAIRVERRTATNVETVVMQKLDFRDHDNTKKNGGSTRVDPRTLASLTAYLDSIHGILKEARFVVIERQMAVNYKASRVFQHLVTYFCLMARTYDHTCIVMDVSSKLKAAVFGAPKRMSYNETKAWGIGVALALLEERQDDFAIDVIRRHKGKSKTKADDLADTVIQVEAWFRRYDVEMHTSASPNAPNR